MGNGRERSFAEIFSGEHVSVCVFSGRVSWEVIYFYVQAPLWCSNGRRLDREEDKRGVLYIFLSHEIRVYLEASKRGRVRGWMESFVRFDLAEPED